MRLLAKLGLLFVCSGFAQAQPIVSAHAGLITYIEGPVYLDAKRLPRTGRLSIQMKPGQTLRTNHGGRAEVLMAPAIVLRLWEDGSIRLDDTRMEDTRLHIETGSVMVEVVEAAKEERLRVWLGDTVTEFKRAGLFRFDTNLKKVRVYGGEAEPLRDDNRVLAKRGQAVDLAGAAVGIAAVAEFDLKDLDPFHMWAAKRSFTLYDSGEDTRNKQKHWKYIGEGWLRNENFGVKQWSGRAPLSYAERQMGIPTKPPPTPVLVPDQR